MVKTHYSVKKSKIIKQFVAFMNEMHTPKTLIGLAVGFLLLFSYLFAQNTA